ncbi:MAG: ATP-dependent protease ATPase subunit HslU [Bacillota bacterium]|nr:MAG: ATP-dependent protease ATPase subunit HslU [Bacillota bacterium]
MNADSSGSAGGGDVRSFQLVSGVPEVPAEKDLTPREIVAELDRYIVGQNAAKRCVAIALRNRYRRQRLPAELQEEIVPKNILMIGPTGVGKTLIARKLARLVNAPFVKVEATKFTEVGYVGRDVDSMVRDLVETAIRIVRSEKMELVTEESDRAAVARLVDVMAPLPGRRPAVRTNPFQALFGPPPPQEENGREGDAGATIESDRMAEARLKRAEARRAILAGELDDEMVEIEVPEHLPPMVQVFGGAGAEEMGINFQDWLGGLVPRKMKKRKLRVKEARRILAAEEANKLIDMDDVTSEACRRAEQSGIIFIDEMDKIAGKDRAGVGPDVSREGVQRDLLPIVEGSTVMTKYGPVSTDHILFIAAGAFHTSKPSDLIPEMQGRFPIRVELDPLGKEDFRRILTEPKDAVTKQYQALLATDGVNVDFTADAIEAIAAMALEVNEQTEDIGARRLHTIMERLLEDLSFDAPESVKGTTTIDAEYVKSKLSDIIRDRDLSRFVL